ncbi:sugar ABC transporter permease [Streptomyces sp. NPDC051776]|uniref:carbohydrate ABC transporter permease n=1 Tax=Streptomyces sp. NPDC051776 TaxID=3155414 RepID=UPI0034305040
MPRPGTTHAKRYRKGIGKARRALAVLLVSPTLTVIALVVGYPVIAAIGDSVHAESTSLDASGFVRRTEEFVGLRHYRDILTGPASRRFWNAFTNTTFFTVSTVVLEALLGVVLALAMHHTLRGRGIVRAGILIPWAVPTVVSAVLWQWIFQADGIANDLIGREVLWTTDAFPAQFAVIVVDTWKTAPFVGLLVLAGLQLIPVEIYEAARVDGASHWQQFIRVTLPLVRPVLLLAVLFRLLDALRMFDLPYVLIGPRKDAVETLTMVAFDESVNSRYGVAAAYAILLFCYVAAVVFVFIRILRVDVLGLHAPVRAPRPRRSGPRRRRRKHHNAGPGEGR